MTMKTQTQFTETQQEIYAMLTENTGAHMLDSGSAYGRHWQRNQSKTIQDFDNEPESIVVFDKRYKYFETEKLNPSYPVISENGGPWVSANYSEMSEFIPPKLLKHLKPPLPLAERDIDALVETRPVISKYYGKN